ncbi:MAG: Rpn family recombination-promoting nuclease/putative transposase [Lachnospiraceae bacterium]|nr:Rpn family recombination-promoting nuclease/putative transposase [Lachnospiraceae bacterium]
MLFYLRQHWRMLFSSDFRCVRLDIFASDELSVGYNLEMQNENEGNLPQRSRYHQAEMDLTSLKPGEDFKELKPSVIVFICNFDPFGRKLYRYTFEPRCLEEDFSLEDGTKRIFLSTVGENVKDVSVELICFLRYVTESTDVNSINPF